MNFGSGPAQKTNKFDQRQSKSGPRRDEPARLAGRAGRPGPLRNGISIVSDQI